MALRKFTVLAVILSIIGFRPATAAPVEGTWAVRDLILDIYKSTGCGFLEEGEFGCKPLQS
jgi:hypothetical protein